MSFKIVWCKTSMVKFEPFAQQAANGAKSTPRGKKGAGRRIESGLGPTVGIHNSFDEYIYVSPAPKNTPTATTTNAQAPGLWHAVEAS